MSAIITPNTPPTSEPFRVPRGGHVQLLADGLQGTDRVVVELIGTTRSGPLPTECCPGEVNLPEVRAAQVLQCRNGARAILTATHPFLSLDTPQEVQLRARLEADDLSVVTVELTAVDAAGCADCQCVEPYCASYPLAPRGFAYAPGDDADPDATVALTVGADVVHIYPTAKRWASVAVRNGATIVGYAPAASACADTNAVAVVTVAAPAVNVSITPDGQVVGVQSLAVDPHGTVTLVQSNGVIVTSNNPNPC